MKHEENYLAALKAWLEIPSNLSILYQEEATLKYGKTTFGSNRVVLAALAFKNLEQVIAAVKVAYHFKIAIYPISKGNNWGYGSSAPVKHHCVIFDLSGLDQIKVYDEKLGIFSVQPGVTYQNLYDYLQKNNYPFYVPTIGAGPNCSVLGNILERGIGVTPISDHFLSATSFKVILPNGELYESAFSALGAPLLDASYKWGIGPYLDGLFTQGAFGISYEVTLCLKAATQDINLVTFFFSNESFPGVVDTLQGITRDYSSHLSGVKIANRRQVLASFTKYPRKLRGKGVTIPEEFIDELGKRFGLLSQWQGFMAVYGDKKIAQLMASTIVARLKKHTDKVTSHSLIQVKRTRSFVKKLPFLKHIIRLEELQSLTALFDTLEGKSSSVNLNIVYWMKDTPPFRVEELNPQVDDCGLIWFSPLIPFKKEDAERMVTLVTQVCPTYGIEPLLGFVSVSSYCLTGLLPIIFEKENSVAQVKAYECYQALFEACKAEGYLPYRMNIDSMNQIIVSQSTYWKLVSAIKQIIDPHQILSPGRYGAVTCQDQDRAGRSSR